MKIIAIKNALKHVANGNAAFLRPTNPNNDTKIQEAAKEFLADLDEYTLGDTITDIPLEDVFATMLSWGAL